MSCSDNYKNIWLLYQWRARALGLTLCSAREQARPSARKGPASLIHFLMEEVPWVPQCAGHPCMSIFIQIWVGSVPPESLSGSCFGAECAQKHLVCSLHPCVGCVKLAGWFRLFPVLWLLKLCGMFKARRDGLQA